MSAFRFLLISVKIVLWVVGVLLIFLAALFGVLAKIGGTILYFLAVCTLLSVIIIIFMNDFSTNSKLISWAAVIGFNVVPGDLGCGFWPNFSHFIVDLIMQATLFDHNRNWYRKKLKEEVDICQCNRAIHRYHQGLSRSGVH